MVGRVRDADGQLVAGTDDLLMLPTRALWEEALADRSARLVLHP